MFFKKSIKYILSVFILSTMVTTTAFAMNISPDPEEEIPAEIAHFQG